MQTEGSLSCSVKAATDPYPSQIDPLYTRISYILMLAYPVVHVRVSFFHTASHSIR
jgi:hypothetical protein